MAARISKPEGQEWENKGYLSICLSIYMSVYLFVPLSVCLFVHHPSIHLFDLLIDVFILGVLWVGAVDRIACLGPALVRFKLKFDVFCSTK